MIKRTTARLSKNKKEPPIKLSTRLHGKYIPKENFPRLMKIPTVRALPVSWYDPAEDAEYESYLTEKEKKQFPAKQKR